MAVFKISSNGKQVEEFDENETRADLRTIFENHGLRFLEGNLRLVDHNVPAGKSSIDTLAVDSSKRPVIIQYMSDVEGSSDNLVQSLSCANYLHHNWKEFAEMISRKLGGLRPEKLNFDNLRVVLVAPAFDSQVIDAARMVAPHMKLVTYTVQKTAEGRAMSTTILYDSEARRAPASHDVSSIESHFAGRYRSMRPAFEKLCREIKSRLNVLPFYGKEFIAFKRNTIFADIHVYSDRLELGLPLPDGITIPQSFLKSPEGRFGPRINHFVRLQSPRDIDEDLMSAISQAYRIS
jgi:hypothetical protein